jgi:hypothetical protein
VQINDDVAGIEQYDQVLPEVGDRVDPQIRIAEQHRAGVSDAKRGADDREIDIREILQLVHSGDIAVARDLRRCRAHDFGARDLGSDRFQRIARGRM